MTTQIVKRYKEEGTFKGDRLMQTRETQRLALIQKMKDEGFVPLLDVNPVWEQSWIKEDIFSFRYTWQAVWAGKGKAWQIEGHLDGKMIPSSPKTK